MLPYSNLQIEHKNPGATKPLILPINVICNTSDEQLYSNIKANSVLPNRWLNASEAHDGIAILCGSGPSLADHLYEIREKQEDGGKIFAMNGAANFLYYNGITPDYQVLIDAREETKQLIGAAKTHLFASQVHPECFKIVPDAVVWHLQVEDIDSYLPDSYEEHVLIGGAASVGNTATCLAYAMGYRELHVYGYDSSHRDGFGHAFHQKMNDGDPCCMVTFNGKEYTVSLTMKLQAERFQETAKDLKALGCKIEVFGDGLLQEMYRNPQVVMSEYEKYKKLWREISYREVSPGELCADKFIEVVKPKDFYRVVDYGCGTGRGSLKIYEKTKCEVVQVDFIEDSRDEKSKFLSFVQQDLNEPLNFLGDYGFCTDVMEHIPPENIDRVLKNIFASCGSVFFQISTVHDNMGFLVGQPLHLTVRSHEWWKKKFDSLGMKVVYEEKGNIASIFYVKENDVNC